MKLFGFALVAAATLAGCTMGDFPLDENGQPVYPEDIVAALPEGVPPSIVFLAADGCYAYAIEVTEPKAGFPLIDRNGNRVCKPASN